MRQTVRQPGLDEALADRLGGRQDVRRPARWTTRSTFHARTEGRRKAPPTGKQDGSTHETRLRRPGLSSGRRMPRGRREARNLAAAGRRGRNNRGRRSAEAGSGTGCRRPTRPGRCERRRRDRDQDRLGLAGGPIDGARGAIPQPQAARGRQRFGAGVGSASNDTEGSSRRRTAGSSAGESAEGRRAERSPPTAPRDGIPRRRGRNDEVDEASTRVAWRSGDQPAGRAARRCCRRPSARRSRGSGRPAQWRGSGTVTAIPSRRALPEPGASRPAMTRRRR